MMLNLTPRGMAKILLQFSFLDFTSLRRTPSTVQRVIYAIFKKLKKGLKKCTESKSESSAIVVINNERDLLAVGSIHISKLVYPARFPSNPSLASGANLSFLAWLHIDMQIPKITASLIEWSGLKRISSVRAVFRFKLTPLALSAPRSLLIHASTETFIHFASPC